MVPKDPHETLTQLSVAERHILLLASQAERDYVVRLKCRIKRARKLETLRVFTVEPIERPGGAWLRCKITDHGHATAKVLLDELKALHFKRFGAGRS